MNRQELIEKYEKIINDNSNELYGCYNKADKLLMQKIYKSVLDDLKQLDEPQKPAVPQFVADWIEYFKNCKAMLYGSTNPFSYYGRAIIENFEGDYEEVLRWIRDNSETYARAWLDGYTVEKEKRYLVKMNGIHPESEYLYYGIGSCKWRFRKKNESGYFRKTHTRKELEDAGFGDVFNSPIFEVEKVQDDSKV